MQFLLASRIRRFVMRKVLVGMVALACAAGGVSACGNNDKTKGKTSVAQAAGVQKTADVASADKSDPSVVRGPQPGAFETAPKAPGFTLVLGQGKGGFKFRSAKLSDEAKAKIDELLTGNKVDLNTARFEIEGYTDNFGSKEVNNQVGLARADAVK